jgi:hypothetical protein
MLHNNCTIGICNLKFDYMSTYQDSEEQKHRLETMFTTYNKTATFQNNNNKKQQTNSTM